MELPYQVAIPVGIASGTVLEANEGRQRVSGVNSSANWIWLRRSNRPAIVGVGAFGLAPNGTFVDEKDRDGYIYKGPWQAIATGALSNLGLEEE